LSETDDVSSDPAGHDPADGASAANVVPLRGRQGGAPANEKKIEWGRLTFLLDNFAQIYGTDTVVDIEKRLIMKISAMAHAHGADYVKMWKNADASPRRFEGLRMTVDQSAVVFDPTGQADAETTINLFGGIRLEPAEGDVEPMLALVRHLTSRASDNADDCDQVMHWLLSWMAYPLQHLGTKLRTAVVVHGDEGAGKNFVFETLLEIYGEYGAQVGQDDLEDKFNDWRSRKLFVLGDEVSSRQELVHNKNRLKALITSPTVQINPKNLPRREEANHINIAFLSNELQPLALDNTDRRYLVLYTPPPLEREFYKRLGAWRAAGGAGAWYHYLLQYPLDDFDPYAPAPITQAKAELIDMNRKTPERFWMEWQGGELSLAYRTCSIDQAYRAYGRYCQRVGDRYPVQKATFSRMLVRMSEVAHKPARVKQIRLVERVVRMLLVTDPPDDGLGPWAFECETAFEALLRSYLHGPRSPGDGSDGEPSA